MTEARLELDVGTVSLRDTGPVTGNIALVLGNERFPTEGWNDFVVVILGAFAVALARLMRRTSETEQVHFMEGPFAVSLTRLEGGEFRIRALERPSREHALVAVRPFGLVGSVLAACDDVLQLCRSAGHSSRDVDQLEAGLAELRNEALKLTS